MKTTLLIPTETLGSIAGCRHIYLHSPSPERRGLTRHSLAFVNTSERNSKENFTPVDPQDVLAKVPALPLTRWNYKTQQHIGHMAQDFYAAFGLGGSDTTITSVDSDGVALAAIQGLNQKLEARSQKPEAENAVLMRMNQALEQRLEKLERLLIKSDN